MKKLLTTAAALALVGGAAYAEVTIGGDAWMGVKYDSASSEDFSVANRFRLKLDGSGTTDGGLSFGAHFKVTGTGEGSVGNSTVSINGDFGTVTVGDNDPADLMSGGVADVGFDGIGVDDIAEKGGGRGGTAADILYEQSIGDISLGLSFGPDGENNDFAVGMKFTSSDITIGAGFDSDDGVSIGAGYTMGQISANGYYTEENENDGIGGDLSYVIDATTITVAFAQNSQDHEAAGLGIAHNLGGGAVLRAGFGQIDTGARESKGEVGITFDF